jgi:hypothetical protein
MRKARDERSRVVNVLLNGRHCSRGPQLEKRQRLELSFAFSAAC